MMKTITNGKFAILKTVVHGILRLFNGNQSIMKHLFLLFLLGTLLAACNDDTTATETGTATTKPAETPETTPPATAQDTSQEGKVMPFTTDGIMETISIVDSATQKVIKVQRPVNPLSTAIGPNPLKKTDPVKPVVVKPTPATPQESRVLRVLTNNYWIVWGLLRINDQAATRQNQGTWFKFNEDGSYEYGFFENKVGSGGWRFDGKAARIYLDSELYGDDREWKVLISSDEDQMVWVGTPEQHTTAIQMKLQNFLFIPKKRSEIGLPD